MATLRGRRRPPAPPPEPPRHRRVHAGGMPRLAAIKLDADWGGPPKLTRRSVGVFVAGALLMLGAAVAGAAWLGGSLFDAREAWAAQADRSMTGIGFAANEIAVEGVGGARAEEVRALVLPQGRTSLLAADPREVKARIESLDWVESARVVRLWPHALRIDVKRRDAFARWQENGVMTVIDAAGERLMAERAADHPELPLVVGRGAAHAAEPVLRALEELPLVRTRLAALVRVENRRWNLELKNGATVALPERDPVIALARVEALQQRHRLLDRPVESLDLRTPGLLAVRARAPLLGGPRTLPEAA